MDQSQRQSSFTSLPQSSNYSSNSPSSFTPPPTLPSPPFSCTPGTDPHAHQGHLVVTRVEREAQAQFDENRNRVSQSSDVTLPAAGLNSSGNNDGLNQSLANNALSTPKQTEMIQLMRCEVCNIQCQPIDFKNHIAGKKHQRNLQVKSNSSSAAFPEPSDGAYAQELERKKQQLLNSGAAFNSIQVCTISKVACNNQEKLAEHLSMRKHAAQLSATGLNSSGSNDGLNQSLVNNVISIPKQTGVIQPMRCEVCNIQCQPIDFEKHIVGKKHRRNLQVESNSTSAAFPEPSNGANAQELERKKQKLLNSGAAFNSIQVCTVCNAACNSHEKLAEHLSGRKHAAQAGQIAVDGIGPDLAAFRANHHFCNEGKKTTEIPQSSWCQVCQIDVYAKHLSGKKHLKNVENLEKSKNGTHDPSVGTPATRSLMIKQVENAAANGGCNVNEKYWEKMAAESKASKEDLNQSNREVMEGGAADAVANNSYCVNVQNPDKMAAQSEVSKEDLELKKQKVMEGGAVAAAVANSSYGDNVRDPEKMEAQFGASKEDSEMRKRKVMEAGVAAAVVANSSYGINVQNPDKLAEQSGAPKKDLETKGHKTMEGGAAAASVANGSFSVNVQNPEKMVAQSGASKEYLETKKQKVMEGVTAAEANSSYGVVQNPEKMVAQSQASKEDLETKRRKVIESGTAAAAVLSCTFCNVVCNSQTVFKHHLAGHKHAAMVKKQASAGIPTSDYSNENQRIIT